MKGVSSEKIVVAQLSPLFRSRGLRSGCLELGSGLLLFILSNIIIFGSDPTERIGAPVMLVWSGLSLLFGLLTILCAVRGWREFPIFMFYWILGSSVIILVLSGLSFTRFVSLGCKVTIGEALCGEAGLISTAVIVIAAYLAFKASTLYFIVMMRREIDYSVTIADESASSSAPSTASSSPAVQSSGDAHRTYGSIGQTPSSSMLPMSPGSGDVVPLDEDEDEQAKGSAVSSLLGPRLYLNEAQRELYDTGVKKFNAKPKRGIEFIINGELMEILLNVRAKVVQRSNPAAQETVVPIDPAEPLDPVDIKDSSDAAGSISPEAADAIAIMLGDSKVISAIKLGSYLGQSDATATAIRRAWVSRMDFNGLDFDKALRIYLTKLILPPETEKIDRLIESFARHFHEQNPLVFSHADTAYVLAFGLLMLHTDAHNPNMKKEAKMTKDQFLRNMRGIDSGRDLPFDFMSSLYDRIVAEEMMTDVARRGYLWKHARPGRGGLGQEWQKRYFILSSDRVLYYYLNHTDKNPRAIIPLEGLEVLKVEHESRPFCFLIRDPHRPTVKAAKRRDDGTLDTATHENFLLSAETEAEQEAWIKSLRRNIDRNPFYTLIKTKVSASAFPGAKSPNVLVSPISPSIGASPRHPSPTKRMSAQMTPSGNESSSTRRGSLSSAANANVAKRLSFSTEHQQEDLVPVTALETSSLDSDSDDDEISNNNNKKDQQDHHSSPTLGNLSLAISGQSNTQTFDASIHTQRSPSKQLDAVGGSRVSLLAKSNEELLGQARGGGEQSLDDSDTETLDSIGM